MEITLNTPALLFPAISLLMLAYTNRFLGLASVVRQLHERYLDSPRPAYLQQIDNLRRRIKLVRDMQIFGVLSLLLCTVCMFLLFRGLIFAGKLTFAASLIAMITSLVLSLIELRMSTDALNLHLQDIEQSPRARKKDAA